MFTECEVSQAVLNSVAEIVEAVGGPAAAAALAGVETTSAVSNWKARGQIPPEHFFAFGRAVKDAGKQVNPAVFGFAGASE